MVIARDKRFYCFISTRKNQQLDSKMLRNGFCNGNSRNPTCNKTGPRFPADYGKRLISLPKSQEKAAFLAGQPIIVYLLRIEDYEIFMKDPQVSQTSKMLSSFFMFFEVTQTPLMQAYTVTQYVPTVGVLRSDRVSARESVIVYTLIAMLGPSFFSDSQATSRQLATIAAEACAEGENTPPSEEQISAAITEIGWSFGKNPSQAGEVVGYTLAITKDWKFNPEVSDLNLVGTKEFCDRYKLAAWFRGLYTQMRLVYRNFQSTSFNLGVSIIRLAWKLFVSLYGNWEKEMRNIKETSTPVRDSYYIGCQRYIHEKHRIATYPRVIYVGVLYHQRRFRDEAKIKEFDKYNINIARIKRHINSVEDTQLCQSIADILPAPDITSIAQLVRGSTPSDIDAVVSSRPSAFRESLHTYMYNHKIEGGWFDFERHQRIKKETCKVKREIMKVIDEKYTSTLRDFHDKAAGARDLAQRDKFLQQSQKYMDVYRTRLIEVEDLESAIGPAISYDLLTLREELIKKYQILFDVACGKIKSVEEAKEAERRISCRE